MIIFHILDWSLIVNGPSVLLSLVSHLFAITILVVWVGLEKNT